MRSQAQRKFETVLYRQLTGRRLGPRTYTVDRALSALGAVSPRPWELAGVSRETWRRWNLPAGRKNAQRPSKRHQSGLLAALRRMSIPESRETRMRQGNITVTLWSLYEGVERIVGPRTLEWRGTGPVIDAFLSHGIEAAADRFVQQVGEDGHFKPWIEDHLEPLRPSSSEEYEIRHVDFLSSPGRSAATRRR